MIVRALKDHLLTPAICLIPIAILIFATGFFPYKPFLAGFASYNDSQCDPPPEARFDKLIFMVVDALRSDFVYGHTSGFHFTQSLIKSGYAIPFTAYASPPTITMPRIKAMSTGSTPSFLDAILNFSESDKSSSLANQDTWLAQMKAIRSGKSVMYGDETWLKLYPETFDRMEGTSSFFVSDFTEVDNNVTRHITGELANNDWNTMVLHFLGLDHIGHKSGPQSPNMVPKQQEMDKIVRQIFEAILNQAHLQSTLLVLLGDHGMNDVGNHGGSSTGETSPALVFISPKLKAVSTELDLSILDQENFRYYSYIDQSDLVPTLAGLFRFPTPKNSIGVFIPQFLSLWPDDNERVHLLLQNANQILRVVSEAYPSFQDSGPAETCYTFVNTVDELSCQWRSIIQSLPRENEESHEVLRWEISIIQWLRQIQTLMSKTTSNYNIYQLILGLTLAILSFSLSYAAANPIMSKGVKPCFPLILLSFLYSIMMFSSSSVEEEQNFWHWITVAWFGFLWIKRARRQGHFVPHSLTYLGSILLIVRISRRWNQTGQKFAGNPDIAKTLLRHDTLLWVLVIMAYLWKFEILRRRGFSSFPTVLAGIVALLISTAALSFKLAFTYEDSPEIIPEFFKSVAIINFGINLLTRARFLFLLLAGSFAYNVWHSLQRGQETRQSVRAIHDLLTLLLYTQSRVENIPLLLTFEILFILLSHLNLDLFETTTTCIVLEYMSFFAFGGSNAISTIDLSSAYNGVDRYNAVSVGVLTFLSNWLGPIFWASATNLLLVRLHITGENLVISNHLALLAIFVTVSLVSVMTACILLRTHLFIWTVFSPKFLYSIAWSIGQFVGVNLGMGGLLFWIGTSDERSRARSRNKPY